jgi:hypothetical protein
MEGLSLAAVLQGSKGPVPEPVAAALVQRVLKVLIAAHGATPPSFQRDLSPSSIVLQPGSVQVLPFDPARASGVHMSAEQAHGQVLDARSDVFSAGALLFHLVCGRPPAQNVTALALGELDAPDASLSPAMKAVLERALKLAPQERFGSAQEMSAALDTASPSSDALDAWLAAAPVAKDETPPSGPLASLVKPRSPAMAVTVLGGVALLGALTAMLAFEYIEHRRALHQMEYEASLRTCGVVSDPTGAQIWLDDRLFPDHTPAVLKLEPGRDYKLEVRGPHGTVTRRIRDQKFVSVLLQGGSGAVVEEESWSPPPPPPEPAPAPAPSEAPQPAGRIIHEDLGSSAPVAIFDAESAPDAFTLTPEHEVLVPESLCLTAPPGTWSVTREPMAFQMLPPGKTKKVPDDRWRGRPRSLGLFFLDAHTGRVELLPKRLETKAVRTLCPFALNDRSLEATAMPLTLTVPGLRAPQDIKGSVINVSFDSRLLVRSLPANKAFRVRISPVQVPYAVMVAFSRGRSDHIVVLDRPEVDVPKDAESVWFTVPVLQRQDLSLSLRIEER